MTVPLILFSQRFSLTCVDINQIEQQLLREQWLEIQKIRERAILNMCVCVFKCLLPWSRPWSLMFLELWKLCVIIFGAVLLVNVFFPPISSFFCRKLSCPRIEQTHTHTLTHIYSANCCSVLHTDTCWSQALALALHISAVTSAMRFDSSALHFSVIVHNRRIFLSVFSSRNRLLRSVWV